MPITIYVCLNNEERDHSKNYKFQFGLQMYFSNICNRILTCSISRGNTTKCRALEQKYDMRTLAKVYANNTDSKCFIAVALIYIR
jgi:hypothetical protein